MAIGRQGRAGGGARRRAAIAATLLLSIAGAARAAPAMLVDALDWGERLYRFLPADKGAGARYAPRLQALIDRDRRAAGDAAALDWQYLCDCRDLAPHYHLANLRARTATAGRATLFVTLANGDAAADPLTLDLLRDPAGGWRIADIHGPRTPSLLARLGADPTPP